MIEITQKVPEIEMHIEEIWIDGEGKVTNNKEDRHLCVGGPVSFDPITFKGTEEQIDACKNWMTACYNTCVSSGPCNYKRDLEVLTENDNQWKLHGCFPIEVGPDQITIAFDYAVRNKIV